MLCAEKPSYDIPPSEVPFWLFSVIQDAHNPCWTPFIVCPPLLSRFALQFEVIPIHHTLVDYALPPTVALRWQRFFPSLSQANITFETVPRDTLAISTAFVTLAPEKRAPTITPRSKSLRSLLAAKLVLNNGIESQPAHTYAARGLLGIDMHISGTSHISVKAPYFTYML